MSDPTRRQFIAATAAAAVCACGGCPLLAAAAPAPAGGAVDIGTVEDFTRDGIIDRWAATEGFFVVRRRRKLYAVSSYCTHKKVALVPARGDDGLKCPRHGSTFDAAGHVSKSPARKPRPRFAIRSSPDGRVVVHTSRQLSPADWNGRDGFVALDPPE